MANAAAIHERTLVAQLDAALNENRRLKLAAESLQPKDPNHISNRVEVLKDILKRLPEQRIPQLEYASDVDWYAAVDGGLDTTEGVRMALARLRASAENRFAKPLQAALRGYLDANGGVFPQEVIQLQPYFDQPVDSAALRHYKVVRADSIKGVRLGDEWAITQVAVIDSDFDSHIVIGARGMGTYGKRSLK